MTGEEDSTVAVAVVLTAAPAKGPVPFVLKLPEPLTPVPSPSLI